MIDKSAGPVMAVELSAGTGSLALVNTDETVHTLRTWPEDRRGSPALWSALSDLWALAHSEGRALSGLVAGRGPGRYTGLRTALTIVQALALPDTIPVHVVDSGRALALAVLRERSPERVAVAGDARRGHCWIAIFRNQNGWPEPETDWRLCPATSDALSLAPNTVGVSPEWSRLSQLPDMAEAGAWINEDRAPDAVSVAHLALWDRANGLPSAPLSPLYLHPPAAPCVPPMWEALDGQGPRVQGCRHHV